MERMNLVQADEFFDDDDEEDVEVEYEDEGNKSKIGYYYCT